MMRVRAGHILSGLGHSGVILWAVASGGMSAPVPQEPRTQPVQIVSLNDFLAATAITPPQAPQQEISAAQEVPEINDNSVVVPASLARPSQAKTTQIPKAKEADALPKKPAPLKPVTAELSQEVPDFSSPDALETLAALRPQLPDRVAIPKPAERIAPQASEAIAPPPPDFTDLRPPDRPEKPTLPSQEPTEKPGDQEKEEATTQIVTEAEEVQTPIDTRTLRPPLRPTNLTLPVDDLMPNEEVAITETPVENEVVEENSSDTLGSAISALLNEAVPEIASPSAEETRLIVGGAVQSILAQAAQCWRVDPGSEAAFVSIVLGMSMSRAGRIIPGTILLVESSSANVGATNFAFRAARQALLECQDKVGGYDLPLEYFEDWQELEVVFNPDFMRTL